ITSDTDMEQEKAVEGFSTDLERAAGGEKDPQVPGFTVKDTYVERRGSMVNVYILGEYKKEAIADKKNRLSALLEGEPDQVQKLEEKAEELYEEQSVYRAAGTYIEAAAEACTAGVDDLEGECRRLIRKAVTALEEISLERMNNNLQGYVGQSFSEPFRVRVFSSTDEDGGLEEIPLEVSYREAASPGERRRQTASILTNGDGIAAFVRPPPRFAGKDTVLFSLEAEEVLSPLASLKDMPDYIAEEIEELRRVADRRSVEFSYTVKSRAKEITTAVWVVGFDNGGNTLPQTDSSSGILEVLNEEEFDVSGISLDPSYTDAPEAEIIEQTEEEYGSRYQRLIFGSARISDFKDEGSRYTVRVTGSVKAADLPSGFIHYDSGELSKSANGQNPQSAISAAFKQFGKHIGQELSEELP
ncbi:MAG: hypothetical protein R6V67_07210, partial [Spirochaetia bacterium]